MGSGCVCETSVWLPRFHIPHHPRAMITTTTEPSANNLRTIWFRCSLWLVGWKLELSRCVELMPTRETQGDESAMNLRVRQPPEVCFTDVLGRSRILRTSPLRSSTK